MPIWNRLKTNWLQMHGSPKAQQSTERNALADAKGESDALVRRLTTAYLRSLMILIALLPLMAISYLGFLQDPQLRFEAHNLYEATSLLAIALGAFITYVTWRCYQASGEVFLRWLTLAFLSFTLIYLPHALLSQISDEMMVLFIAYGPASRLAMGICFLIALERLGAPPDPPNSRRRPKTWWQALGIILAVNLGLAALMLNPVFRSEILVRAMEAMAFVLLLASVLMIAFRRIRLSLMIIYLLSIAIFAQASIAFMISAPWSHLWWLAHGIFIAGFFLLSYGVVHAFQTTRSFSTVFSQSDVVAQLREQYARTAEALAKLERTNTLLTQQASTDWLTGVANRRYFMRQSKRELARAKRNGTPLSLLCLDLDYFKAINDLYGHQVGDQVLKCVAATMEENLRPTDLLARVGGDEFQVLLPDADLQQAREIAERVRSALHRLEIKLREKVVKITVSMGCAQMGQDGTDMDSLIRAGDQRLYEAKAFGRDRVEVGTWTTAERA